MKPGDDEATAEPIIIIRRHGHQDEHHHGGVWKIAYADFMTAMMAFFLVMWLINAANTETKASVASYFNPIKLTDSVARKKGLLDIDERANAPDQSKRGDAQKADSEGEAKKSQAADKAKGGASKSEGSPKQGKKDEAPAASASATRIQADATTRQAAAEPGRAYRDSFSPATNGLVLPRDAVGQSESARPPQVQSASTSPENGSDAAGRSRELEAAELLKKTQEMIKRLGISGGPGIDVTIEGDDIVMSLADTSTFGMFSVGSAEPNELLLRLMQSLTPVLNAHGDRIIIRGHTDSRPFRGEARNNNWRLAMARAEAAYAILLRSGIEEGRFERIEGHADRKPRIAADTEAAANRRIEILMRRSTR